MQMDREQCHSSWRWVQIAGMGLQGQKKLSVSSFTLQMGWDRLTQTMEEGTADENSIPLRGEGCLTNGSGSCPKEAAGPSHLPRVERGLEVGWTDKP